MSAPCLHCGEPVPPRVVGAGGSPKRYCKAKCRRAARRSRCAKHVQQATAIRQSAMLKTWDKVCPRCGDSVPPPLDGRADSRKKWCSTECRILAGCARRSESIRRTRRDYRHDVRGRVCAICGLTDAQTTWSGTVAHCQACDRQRYRVDALGRKSARTCTSCGGPRWVVEIGDKRKRVESPKQARSGLCLRCWQDRDDETEYDRLVRERRERRSGG